MDQRSVQAPPAKNTESRKARVGNFRTDRGWAWVILIASFIQSFLMTGFRRSLGLYFVEFMEIFDSPASHITYSFGVARASFCITSFLILNVGARLCSNRMYIILGGITGMLSHILNAFAPTVFFLILSQGVLFGMTNSFVQGPTFVMLNRYFQKKRGLAVLIGNVGGSVGGLVLPQLINYLLSEYGGRGAMIILAGVLLNFMVVGALMRPVEFYKGKAQGSFTKKKMAGDSSTDEKMTNSLLNAKTTTGFRKETDIGNNDGDLELSENTNKSVQNSEIQLSSRTDILSDSKTEEADDIPPVSSKEVHTTDSNENSAIETDGVDGINSSENRGSHNKSKISKEKSRKISKRDIKKFFTKFIDLNVLKSRLFQMYMPVAFLSIPCAEVITFIPPYSQDLGINKTDTALLITILGVTDLVSKTILALVIDRKIFKKYQIMAIGLILTGIQVMLSPLVKTFTAMLIFCIANGIVGGLYSGLFPAVIVEFVGLPRLPGALGITLLIHGAALSITTPCAGLIRDSTGSYISAFLMLGTCSLVAGVLLLSEPLLRKYEERRIESLKSNKDKL